MKPGTVLCGRYSIKHCLGIGSQAEVYLATDRRTNTSVALKTPFRPLEATLLSRLHHPQIPAGLGICEAGETRSLIMEWIRGEALSSRYAGERLMRLATLDRLIRHLCPIFAYLEQHDPPIVYNDLHLGNVMWAADGRILLIDFGEAYFGTVGSARRGATYALCGLITGELLDLLAHPHAHTTIRRWCRERALQEQDHARGMQVFSQEWEAMIASLTHGRASRTSQ
jgi:serine/threonine protein kinase